MFKCKVHGLIPFRNSCHICEGMKKVVEPVKQEITFFDSQKADLKLRAEAVEKLRRIADELDDGKIDLEFLTVTDSMEELMPRQIVTVKIRNLKLGKW